MATYKSFEDLPVWKKSRSLVAEVLPWAAASEFRGMGDLANQLQRASISVINNISEGFERGSTNELLQFLYYARGSAGECRSMLCVMEIMPHFDGLAADIGRFKSEFENISRQLRGWAASLQETEIKGQRHLNEASKASYDRKQKQSEFMKQQEEWRTWFQEKIEREAAERCETREAKK